MCAYLQFAAVQVCSVLKTQFLPAIRTTFPSNVVVEGVSRATQGQVIEVAVYLA
jgi:hypothetical protein